MEELLQHCSQVTGYEKKVVENVVAQFLELIVQQLKNGHSVDLGESFGTFSVKMRAPKLSENSPRTPKQIRSLVVFRENSGLRQRLKF